MWGDVARSMRARLVATSVVLTGAAAALFAWAPPAGAATVLRFFSVVEQAADYDSSGKLITSPNTTAVVGDQFQSTHFDYSGTYKHHTRTYSATDHLACTLTALTSSGGTGLCDVEIAIGGSMVLAEDSPVTFAGNGSLSPIPINGGTGRFQGAKGTLVSDGIAKTDDANLIITLTKT